MTILIFTFFFNVVFSTYALSTLLQLLKLIPSKDVFSFTREVILRMFCGLYFSKEKLLWSIWFCCFEKSQRFRQDSSKDSSKFSFFCDLLRNALWGEPPNMVLHLKKILKRLFHEKNWLNWGSRHASNKKKEVSLLNEINWLGLGASPY